MDNNLIISTSPHIRADINTRKIMCQVIVALVPVTVWAVVIHGLPAFWVLLSSIAGAMLGEFLVVKGRRQPVTLDDCSALLTGLLLALTLPPLLPWWIAAVAGLTAAILGKQVFGGLGHNLFNPALVGRAVAFVSWTAYMTQSYAKSAALSVANTAAHRSIEAAVDVAGGASPLAAMKIVYDPATSPIGPGGVPQGIQGSTYYQPLLFANPWGCLGEVSALLLILGGIYLVATRVIDWRIPVTYVATVAALTALTGRDPLFYTLAGGLLIGAIYMATDYTTSPLARRGRYLFGIGLGFVTWLLRFWSNNPEGVMFAILFMNALVPLIDRYILPYRYGKSTRTREVSKL
jgi:Na+-translocating ferredoxin:NAD+ oxidoreductase subunit D